MKKLPGLFIIFVFLTVFCLRAHSSPLKIMSFQASGYMAMNGSTSLSGHLAWTPTLDLMVFAVRGELGATLLKAVDSYLVTNYQVFGKMGFFEAGVGFETAHVTGGSTNFMLTGNVVIGMIGPIDRIFAGYSRIFSVDINEFKAGIGLVF